MSARGAAADGALPRSIVVTCEHASRAVPRVARAALAPARGLLATHRGFDQGARALARDLAAAAGAPLLLGRATRLAIDLNRSLEGAYSRWSAALDPAARARLERELWTPFRAAARAAVQRGLRAGDVLHLSVHTFTPRFRGETRAIDVALLFDPRRPRERALADRWLRALARRRPDLRLARNAPYRGDSDGHTTALRAALAQERYLGIELEVSQRFPRGSPARWRALRADLCATLLDLRAGLSGRTPRAST